jgi:hypothetical protein
MRRRQIMSGERPTPDRLQRGECDCHHCKAACEHRPGWFLPEQIEPLAKSLGITTAELFKEHLQVDWWVGSPDIFLLAPRLKGETGGTIYPGDPCGICHWFRDGKCEIHTHGKPAECQQLGHEGGRVVTGDREKIADAWRGAEHQQMVRDLYGLEPEAPDCFPFGMWGLTS